MARLMLMAGEECNQNWSLITFIKVMYWFGYLPFSWVSEKDPEYSEIKFRISSIKTCIMLIVDLLLAMLIPLYFYLFNVLNVDPDFNPKQYLNPKFYIDMNDGIVTSAMSQMIYVNILVVGAWAFSFTGLSIF